MASCSAGAAAAAAATTGVTLFQYNRENYMYDRKMRQEMEYQIMEYKIKKADLFREDVKDLVALYSVKMDTYLIVNAVQLGFVVMALCEGRLAPGTPAWLVGAHTLAMAGAFSYYLMSVLFAMHTTVVSKSYEVKMMTQWVRLPVPSWSQLEGARTYGSSFEKTSARQMFRVPFLSGTQEDVLERSMRNSGAPSSIFTPRQEVDKQKQKQVVSDTPAVQHDEARVKADAPRQDKESQLKSADPWGLEAPGDSIYELDGAIQTDTRNLKHIQLMREAISYWQAYDAFARAAQSIGTNQLCQGMAYYVLGYCLASNRAVHAAYFGVILFLGIIWGLIRFDMSLTRWEYVTAVLLAFLGPVLACPCVHAWESDEKTWVIPYLMPLAYLFQCFWALFLVYICKVRVYNNGVILPRGFRSVVFIDVFGWIMGSPSGTTQGQKLSELLENPTQLQAPENLAGSGPAMQTVRYAHGEPVPVRVEQLPGSSVQQQMNNIDLDDFKTKSFVPHRAEDQEDHHSWEGDIEPNAGGRPWAIFKGTTLLLAVLWFLSDVMIFTELWGFSEFEVPPLLQEPPQYRKKPALLQSGQVMSTSWPNTKGHAHVRPIGLACDSSSGLMLAYSQYGLYVANLKDKGHMSFQPIPWCEDIAGEALQDVALHCNFKGSACRAVILHGRGQRFASCAVLHSDHLASSGLNSTMGSLATSRIAEDWLAEDSVMGSASKETAVSLAMSRQCSEQVEECAYVGTSGQRIAELHKATDSGEWFPNRLVHMKSPGTSAVAKGAMSLIDSRHLGVLQPDGQHIQVLDLENGGALSQSWYLPDLSGGASWNSMCVARDELFLLTKESSPRIWRFQFPYLETELGDRGGAETKMEIPSAFLLESKVQRVRHSLRRWK